MWSFLTDGFEDDSFYSREATSTDSPPFKKRRKDEHVESDSLNENAADEMKTFSTQREALEELMKQEDKGKDARIFSKEDTIKGDGARTYIVTTVNRFWKEYSRGKDKHYYEVIASHQRCRLYFDLEFDRSTNKEVDELKCIDHFMQCVIRLVREMCSLEIDKHMFLLLDSSTSSKFSMHAIVHFPNNILFPSSCSIKPFSDRLREKLLSSPPFRLRSTDGSRETVMMDQSVYSRNRNFRLFLSSKAKKNIPLVRAHSCSFYDYRTPSDRQVFLDSLCVPSGWSDYEELKIDEDPTAALQKALKGPQLRDCHGPSPFPILEEFILTMLKKWKDQEYFKKWTLEGEETDPHAITYYPALGRYCFNIQREHKSNGTYWRVDLKKMTFVQRCFDYADCRGMSSNVFPLPSIVVKSIQKCLGTNDKESDHEDNVENNETKHFFDKWEGLFEE